MAARLRMSPRSEWLRDSPRELFLAGLKAEITLETVPTSFSNAQSDAQEENYYFKPNAPYFPLQCAGLSDSPMSSSISPFLSR